MALGMLLFHSAGVSQETTRERENPNATSQPQESWNRPSGTSGLWDRILQSLRLKPSPAKAAERSYASGDFDAALRSYSEAALADPESQALAYNMGNSHYRKGRYEEAAKHFEKALKGEDARIASRAYYNLGNVFFRQGEAAVKNGGEKSGEKALAEFREALAHFKKSLEIRPGESEPKRNIEITQARIKELLEQQKQESQQGGGPPPPEPSERAKQVLARAMQLAAQRKYGEAKSLLESIIREDATAESYKSHVQRIQDVLDLMEGKMPEPPGAGDPRSRQEGLGVI